MPKVVVYIRAEDARVIEATEARPIELWVRSVVRQEVSHWHQRRVSSLDAQMPERWQRRQETLEDEGA